MKKTCESTKLNVLDRIPSVWWSIIAFSIFTCVLILLHNNILSVAYLHAEDGTVFFNDYTKHGLGSFFMTQGGYFCTISRIFTAISLSVGHATNSMVIAVNTLNVVAILFIALTLTYFASDEFEGLLPSRVFRIAICVVLIGLSSNFYAMLYNGVGIHWWCGLVVFFASLNLVNGKLPSLKFLPLVLISIISSASTMILGFVLLYYMVKRIDFKNIKKSISKISIKDKIIVSLMIVFLAIQAYAILFMGTAVSDSTSKVSYVELLYYTFAETIQSINFVLGTGFYSGINQALLAPSIGILLWLIVFVCFINKDKLKYAVLVFFQIFATYFMVSYKRPDALGQYKWLTVSGISNFYNFLPALIITVLVFFCIFLFVEKKNKYLVCFIFGAIAIFALHISNMDKIDLQENKELTSIDKYVDFKSNKYAKINITPYGYWYVLVPVEKGYCNEFECVKSE